MKKTAISFQDFETGVMFVYFKMATASIATYCFCTIFCLFWSLFLCHKPFVCKACSSRLIIKENEFPLPACPLSDIMSFILLYKYFMYWYTWLFYVLVGYMMLRTVCSCFLCRVSDMTFLIFLVPTCQSCIVKMVLLMYHRTLIVFFIWFLCSLSINCISMA